MNVDFASFSISVQSCSSRTYQKYEICKKKNIIQEVAIQRVQKSTANTWKYTAWITELPVTKGPDMQGSTVTVSITSWSRLFQTQEF